MEELFWGVAIAVWFMVTYRCATRTERRARRVPACWRRAAAELGLELTPGRRGVATDPGARSF